jgi:magnesium-transporting ATPase (P-type)
MVVKKVWVPVTTAFVAKQTRAPYNTDTGQLYGVESGREYVIVYEHLSQANTVHPSPYYPRGIVRAIGPDDEVRDRGDLDEDDDVDSDDLMADDIVRIDSLEPSLQDFVQCAALNNMASIHKSKTTEKDGGINEVKGWDANGDPTEIALQVFSHKVGHGKPHL